MGRRETLSGKTKCVTKEESVKSDEDRHARLGPHRAGSKAQ